MMAINPVYRMAFTGRLEEDIFTFQEVNVLKWVVVSDELQSLFVHAVLYAHWA